MMRSKILMFLGLPGDGPWWLIVVYFVILTALFLAAYVPFFFTVRWLAKEIAR